MKVDNKIFGDRYQILHRIGEGGMAYVYVAKDLKLGRKVAIKVLHKHMASNKDIRRRFHQEAQAISSLDHRNILKIYDFSGKDSEELWIVTEILKGFNLNEFALKFPKKILHPIIASCIVREILKALNEAHNNNLIHRDIKPENVMILENGQIKLMDFGIAKNLRSNSMTMTGTFMGSPSYMSQEQIKGKHIDHRSDLYSLGVLFYEIITGQLPFYGNTTHDVSLKICEGKYISPNKIVPSIPDDLNSIIKKSLNLNPDKRYQKVSSFASDLDIFLSLNGFAESHIELERYFTNKAVFENKLRSLDFNASVGKITKPYSAQYANVAKASTITKKKNRSKEEANTLIIHRSIAQQKIVSFNQNSGVKINNKNKPKSISKKILPSKQRITYGSAAERKARQSMQKIKKKRIRPKIPKRKANINIQYIIKDKPTHASAPEWISYILGIALIALIGTLLYVGFSNIKFQNVSLNPKSNKSKFYKKNTSKSNKVALPQNIQNLKHKKIIKTPQNIKQTNINNNKIHKEHQTGYLRQNKKVNYKKNKTKSQNIKYRKYDKKSYTRKRSPRINKNTKTKSPFVKTKINQPVIKKPVINKPTKIVHFHESPIITKAKLIINSEPAADIYIDNKHYGTTIDKTINSGIIELSPGKHILELKRKNFQIYKRRIFLKSGDYRVFNKIKLAPILKGN